MRPRRINHNIGQTLALTVGGRCGMGGLRLWRGASCGQGAELRTTVNTQRVSGRSEAQAAGMDA